jgi:ribA/ribD-fused uncharacterized protein
MNHNTYNLQWLLNKVEKKENVKYLFFWGHQPSSGGEVTTSCFSQWWHEGSIVDDIYYKTAEHWMMAKKAELFSDTKMLEKILIANSPAEAKQLGRQVRNFDPAVWNENCFDIVCQGNYHKFSQHENLKEFLLNTKNRVIVEASPRDRIWGIGMGKSNENAERPQLWRGENLLGFALMEVRDKLKINEK